MKNKAQLKISIRTFVLGANHGQLLQAWGLKCLVESLIPQANVSHDLYHNHLLREVKIQLIRLNFIKAISLLYSWVRLIKFSRPGSIRDITIFGADTIWMKDHPVAPDDLYYFGQNVNSGRLIAFSPSNAGSPYLKSDKTVTDQLNKFEFIGVRDSHTFNFAKEVTSKKISLTCDPAFFVESQYWRKDDGTENTENYVAIYATRCKKVAEIENNFLNLNTKGFGVSCFKYFGYFPSILSNPIGQALGPVGVLRGIKKSRLLITDTFHGVIMALITETPFLLINSDIVASRLEGPLLDLFDNRRIVHPDVMRDLYIDPWIYKFDDFNKTELVNYTNKSKELLKDYFERIYPDDTL